MKWIAIMLVGAAGFVLTEDDQVALMIRNSKWELRDHKDSKDALDDPKDALDPRPLIVPYDDYQTYPPPPPWIPPPPVQYNHPVSKPPNRP